jgi:hypothetical protein
MERLDSVGAGGEGRGQAAWHLLSYETPVKAQGRCGSVPMMVTSLCPLSRWGCLEALKKDKGLQLAHCEEVCSFLQECGPTRAQLQDVILQLETLDPGSSKDSHCALQLIQQKVLVLEKRIHYLQSVVLKYGRVQHGAGVLGGSEGRGRR